MEGRYQFSIRTLLFLITWASVFLAVLPQFPRGSTSFGVAMLVVWLGMAGSGLALVKWEERRKPSTDRHDE